MQFKQDAHVYSSDGQDVGHVDRVVLNPRSKEVTHIVVRKGFLFAEDKLLPMKLFTSAAKDRVVLNVKASSLEGLPLFEETHYVPLNDEEKRFVDYPPGMAYPLYWYLPMSGWMEPDTYPPAFRTEVQQNIPENTVALREGGRVVSADGKHVGDVERVFTDSTTNRATHFLISQGILLKEKKAVPVSWIRRIGENEIQLSVSTAMLNDLHEYQEA